MHRAYCSDLAQRLECNECNSDAGANDVVDAVPSHTVKAVIVHADEQLDISRLAHRTCSAGIMSPRSFSTHICTAHARVSCKKHMHTAAGKAQGQGRDHFSTCHKAHSASSVAHSTRAHRRVQLHLRKPGAVRSHQRSSRSGRRAAAASRGSSPTMSVRCYKFH